MVQRLFCLVLGLHPTCCIPGLLCRCCADPGRRRRLARAHFFIVYTVPHGAQTELSGELRRNPDMRNGPVEIFDGVCLRHSTKCMFFLNFCVSEIQVGTFLDPTTFIWNHV